MPLPDGQLAPALLRLHQRDRRPGRHRRRLSGLGHEPELLGRRPRRHPRRDTASWAGWRPCSAYPASAEGILVSGGSMANFTALAAARRAMTPGNVREDGLGGPDRPRLVVYASDQVHSCVDKAVDLLGHRHPPAPQARERRRTSGCRTDAARARPSPRTARPGYLPAIVVGNAGTVNTGAIDPLDELADFCAGEKLWFHVDGAYGALATMVARAPSALRGHGARRLDRRRPAQVALRPVRGRRHARAGARNGSPTPSASSPSTSPPTRRVPSRGPPGSRSAGWSSRAASRP